MCRSQAARLLVPRSTFFVSTLGGIQGFRRDDRCLAPATAGDGSTGHLAGVANWPGGMVEYGLAIPVDGSEPQALQPPVVCPIVLIQVSRL